METRTAQLEDAENITRLVNVAFRPERFFIDTDRTNPGKSTRLDAGGKVFAHRRSWRAHRLRVRGTA